MTQDSTITNYNDPERKKCAKSTFIRGKPRETFNAELDQQTAIKELRPRRRY